MRLHSRRLVLAVPAALVLSAWASLAVAQDTLLDARSSLGDEVATLRTDSMRLLVPLHLLLGGLVFPDGSVMSTAAGLSTVTTAEIQDGTIVDADIAANAAIQDTKLGTIQTPGTVLNTATTATSSYVPNAIVARDGAGGFAAGAVSLTTSGSGTDPALSATTGSLGPAGRFQVLGAGNGNPAVQAATVGAGPAVSGYTTGTGNAANFVVGNASSTAVAVQIGTNGGGTGLVSTTTGTGRAGYFSINNTGNTNPALFVTTNSTNAAGRFEVTRTTGFTRAVWATTVGEGFAIYGVTTGTGVAARFDVNNPASDSSALYASSYGTGAVGTLQSVNGAGPILVGKTGGNVVFRVENTGNVFADGTFTGGGADVAEAFAVEGEMAAYEPGDVLVVSRVADRTMARSSEAYSTRVAGVYATKPGVLLGDRERGVGPDGIPLGVVGVIPTKVTADGGPIRRGDLLVTSATPGHAMRADPARLGFGMVLGKALEPFDGPGEGVILVLVNVR